MNDLKSEIQTVYWSAFPKWALLPLVAGKKEGKGQSKFCLVCRFPLLLISGKGISDLNWTK
jgi:hypothetical protein